VKFGSLFKNMSRIGKKPILIPEDVEVKLEGQIIKVKGPKGELSRQIHPEIKIEIKDNQIIFSPLSENKKNKALWGLSRMLVANMIQGVKEGYERKLEMVGIGFKASLEGEDLVLSVGFTHPVKVKPPQGIKFSVDKNIITVSGIDKELVSQTAANIRKIKKPEPYKGKGIKYLEEKIRRKLGKKAVATK
jgi:large subunit ribosomal protein L6